MRGRLEVIAGPMFSGKTDELISRFDRAVRQGNEVVAFKPARDTRHPTGRIVSHSGRAVPALSVASPQELKDLAGDARLVVIDEVQFFDGTLRKTVDDLRRGEAAVIVAGLDLDFRRAPFETTSLLISDASAFHAMTAICARCGGPAALTQRIANGRPAPLDSPRLVVGDGEMYEPRCESCWRAERAGSLA